MILIEIEIWIHMKQSTKNIVFSTPMVNWKNAE